MINFWFKTNEQAPCQRCTVYDINGDIIPLPNGLEDKQLWKIAAIFCWIVLIAEFILIGCLITKNQNIQHSLNELEIKYYRLKNYEPPNNIC